MKQLITYLFLIFFSLGVDAQEVTVKSFKSELSDLSAMTNRRFDINDDACALIKVQYPKPGATFEGIIIGEVEYKNGEYWVYLSKGTKRFKVHLPEVPTIVVKFADYGVQQVESNITYSLNFTTINSKKNTVEELSVAASLSPSTSRIHFRGKSGTSIKVKGLKCYTQFNKSTHALSSSTDDISLTVRSNGYTDYVYCLFASSSKQLAIVNDGITYTRSFGSNVLLVGHSGYIDIPTESSHNGWTSDKKPDDIGIGGDDYDSDEDWNQEDPDNITIGGEDWNQADSGGSDSNMHNGHEYVDLGLPSGLKWATCNVGASKPEEYGDYYAWGDAETKASYNWSNYKWSNGTSTTITKYCDDASYGTVDNKMILDLEDDAAHVKWGGSWRMPTKEEQDELRVECSWTWTTLNGVKGCKVTGRNGSSLFLPAAGFHSSNILWKSELDGYYWSSSLYIGKPNYAYCIDMCSSSVSGDGYHGRDNRRTVRPVCP